MNKFLTCDINSRTYMSYGPCYRCSEGKTTQPGSHPTWPARAIARGRRTPGPGLVHLEASSLSLSPAGSAAQTTASRGRCQSFLHGQALAPSGGNAPDVRGLNRIDLERDRQPSVAGGTASRGRPWLSARQVGNERFTWSINLIACGRRNGLRLMNASCLTRSGSPSGQLPHRPEASRRF